LILDYVAPYSEEDLVDFRFIGTDVDDKTAVGNNFSFWGGLTWGK
jgi:hypothetical protein